MLNLKLIRPRFGFDRQHSIVTRMEKSNSLDRESVNFGNQPTCVPTPSSNPTSSSNRVPLLLIDGTILF